MMFDKMVLAARWILGLFYLLSGLNWFFGFIPMLPHVGMAADLRIKHQLVVEMINSGWLFQLAKIIELLFGLSLLANRVVPLLLAAALPVAFITFMLDALILDDLVRWLQGTQTSSELWAAIADMIVGGLCVLLPHLWLIWCYFGYYRPALAWQAKPEAAWHGGISYARDRAHAPASPRLRLLFFAFGWLALGLQTFNLALFVRMIGG
jgi:hypothetical protein